MLPVPKRSVTLIGNGHDLKAGEGIIERHLHLGTALGIKRHHGLPQQQGIKQFARIAAATATTRPCGFSPQRRLPAQFQTCAVAVLTLQLRWRHSPSAKFQVVLGISS